MKGASWDTGEKRAREKELKIQEATKSGCKHKCSRRKSRATFVPRQFADLRLYGVVMGVASVQVRV